MLIAIMTVELLVVHPLLAFWWPAAALVLSILAVASIAWLVVAARSFRRLPVLLTDDELILRSGRITSLTIPLSLVADACGEVDAEVVKASDTLNLAMLSWPNIVVALGEPRRSRRRTVTRVMHRMDDAPAFLAALSERLEAKRG